MRLPARLARALLWLSAVRKSAAGLVALSAQAAAAALGVKPERLDYAIKLADLSSIEVGDDMKVDGEAVKAAIQKVVDDLPELAGAAASTPAANPASETNPVYTPEKLAGMSMEEYRAYRQKNGFPKN